jgi:hypothetical protein
MMDLDEDLARVASAHHLQEFEGGHGWAMPDGFDQAIDWLQLQAMREGRTPRDAAWIKAQFDLACARAAEQARPFPAWLAWRQVQADFSGLVDLGVVPARVQALEADPALQSARKQEAKLREDEKRYQLVVDAWATRMYSRQPDGSAQDPPAKPQSLADLKVRSLQKLAADPDPALAQSARRRLELAHVAAGYYVPSAAEAQSRPATAKAARAVADAIFPDRAEVAN